MRKMVFFFIAAIFPLALLCNKCYKILKSLDLKNIDNIRYMKLIPHKNYIRKPQTKKHKIGRNNRRMSAMLKTNITNFKQKIKSQQSQSFNNNNNNNNTTNTENKHPKKSNEFNNEQMMSDILQPNLSTQTHKQTQDITATDTAAEIQEEITIQAIAGGLPTIPMPKEGNEEYTISWHETSQTFVMCFLFFFFFIFFF